MPSRPFVLAVAIVLSAASLLNGQQKPAAAQPAVPAKVDAVKPNPPEPTELQSTQLENLSLRMALLQQEEQSLPQRKMELQQRYGSLVREIESQHPGFAWNPQMSRLLPVPKPEAKKAEGEKK